MGATEDAASRRPARPGGTRLRCETSSSSFHNDASSPGCDGWCEARTQRRAHMQRIWARPRTQPRAAQRGLAAQGFVVKRALARAVIFDFNGTLSDDEHVICRIVMDLFAEHGRPLSAQEYYDRLAGLSDEEIVLTWFGEERPD